MDEKFNHIYKIVLIGDAGVGKTHLINRYVRKSMPQRCIPTIGVEFATMQVQLRSGEMVKAQLWDTAGQEKYRAITSAHYRRAVGAIIVYDITNKKTFESTKKWLEEVRENSDTGIVLALLGNKLDLIEKTDKNPLQRVNTEEAKQFAQEQSLYFREVSAFNENLVENFFQDFFEEIYETKNIINTETDQESVLYSSQYSKQNSTIVEKNNKNKNNNNNSSNTQGQMLTSHRGKQQQFNGKKSNKDQQKDDDSMCCN